MKCVVCAIARLENKYIREWVEHYKSLGFSNVILYDNNFEGEDDVREVLGDYIDCGYILYNDARNMENYQNLAYTDAFNKYRNMFDWIAFFDIDEFLVIDGGMDITSFIDSNRKFMNYDIIRFPWKVYTDGDLVRVKDGNYSIKRFTKTYKDNADFCDSYRNDAFCKSIIRCSNKDVTKISAHGCYQIKNACDPDGNKCNNTSCRIGYPPRKTKAWLNHYWTKTIEEYLDTKYKRGDATTDVNKYLNMSFFFNINKKTDEKIEYLKNKGILV